MARLKQSSGAGITRDSLLLQRLLLNGWREPETGMCERQLTNKTSYCVRVMITGSVDRAFELAANESNSVELPAGSYKLAVRALDGSAP